MILTYRKVQTVQFARCDDMAIKKPYFHHNDQLIVGIQSAEFDADISPRKSHKKKVIEKSEGNGEFSSCYP
jgi:hypothetical protein